MRIRHAARIVEVEVAVPDVEARVVVHARHREVGVRHGDDCVLFAVGEIVRLEVEEVPLGSVDAPRFVVVRVNVAGGHRERAAAAVDGDGVVVSGLDAEYGRAQDEVALRHRHGVGAACGDIYRVAVLRNAREIPAVEIAPQAVHAVFPADGVGKNRCRAAQRGEGNGEHGAAAHPPPAPRRGCFVHFAHSSLLRAA